MFKFIKVQGEKQAAIVDVDGTLAVVKHLAHLVVGPRRDLDTFHVKVADVPVNNGVLREVKKIHRGKVDIFIVTARPNAHRQMTLRWLKQRGVPFKELIMRRDGDGRSSAVMKRDVVRGLKAKGYSIVKAWDDEPDVVMMLRSEGIDTTQVPGWIGR